jgi:hypothetical protein
VTATPVLGEAAPEFSVAVEAGLRKSGRAALADQIPDLRVVSFCNCAQRCSAFHSVPRDARPAGKVTTNFVMNTPETGIVLVDTVDDLIVGLDVLDDGQLRTAVEYFAKPS